MRIDIITVLPEIFEGPFNNSILKRAIDSGIVQIKIVNLRDYSLNKHKTIDDYAFGGGAGMVIQVEPVFNCITDLKSQRQYDEIIYLTPDGEKFNQKIANEFSTHQNIILLCGHYKGIDHRIRENLITREISIGDYVITGGELAAAIVADSVVRLIPGAMSDISSALTDSFQDNILAPPLYSRPETFNGWKVPDVLLSGNQKMIDEWNLQQSIDRTKRLRPDLLE